MEYRIAFEAENDDPEPAWIIRGGPYGDDVYGVTNDYSRDHETEAQQWAATVLAKQGVTVTGWTYRDGDIIDWDAFIAVTAS